MKIHELTGGRYGRLTVVSRNGNPGDHPKWNCLCDCGSSSVVWSRDLVVGRTSSCGCLAREKSSQRLKTHGLSKTPEYNLWNTMRSRCNNPKAQSYESYGGRGTTVCERWVGSFENFISDMGARPSTNHTVERVRNSEGYSPDNCVWATREEQANNMRSNRVVVLDGQAFTLKQAAKSIGISSQILARRLNKGMSVAEVLVTVTEMEPFPHTYIDDPDDVDPLDNQRPAV